MINYSMPYNYVVLKFLSGRRTCSYSLFSALCILLIAAIMLAIHRSDSNYTIMNSRVTALPKKEIYLPNYTKAYHNVSMVYAAILKLEQDYPNFVTATHHASTERNVIHVIRLTDPTETSITGVRKARVLLVAGMFPNEFFPVERYAWVTWVFVAPRRRVRRGYQGVYNSCREASLGYSGVYSTCEGHVCRYIRGISVAGLVTS